MKSSRVHYLLIGLIFLALGAVSVLSPVSGKPAACVEPPPDLVSWWPAENSAEDVSDGNDGTVHGATFAPGTVGQAFSFDGSDDYVGVPDATNLDGQTQFTAEAWIRPDSRGWPNPDPDSDYEAAIISKYNSSPSDQRSYVFGLQDGYLRLSVYGPGSDLLALSDAQVAIGSWSHVAGVWDGSTITLYVDGTEVAATITGTSPSQTNDSNTAVNIGRVEGFSGTFSGPAAFFDGLVDEVTVYNRALSAGEISGIAAAGSSGKCGDSTKAHLPLVMKPLPTPTPTATATPRPSQVIANGGFEQGHTGWSEYSAYGYAIILHENDLPVPAHGGSWATWFGGAYEEASILEQTITIPSGQDVLNYWLWIASEDVCGTEYDIAGVLVDDEAVDAYYLCSPNNTGGWINRSVDLSGYAGRQVTLTFAAFTDSILNSNLFIDDVSMQSTSQILSGGPQVELAAKVERKSGGKREGIRTLLPDADYGRLLRQLLESE